MDADPQVLNGEDTRAAPPQPGTARCDEPDGPPSPLHIAPGVEELGHQTASPTHQKPGGPPRRQIARTILIIAISIALVAAMTGLCIIGWSHAYVG